jgi:hypothetical protein
MRPLSLPSPDRMGRGKRDKPRGSIEIHKDAILNEGWQGSVDVAGIHTWTEPKFLSSQLPAMKRVGFRTKSLFDRVLAP